MKIKLTKGELKKQRDALKQYTRYLPTLQLKKQQLQMEILHQHSLLTRARDEAAKKQHMAQVWAGLLAEQGADFASWIRPLRERVESRNIAGVDIPLFQGVDFAAAEYDLFLTPLWYDAALEALREIVTVRHEVSVIERGIAVLQQELRVTAQRVNLFEKVKIPGALEAIRRIKIFIGDQMTNAVGRSKIAKRKIEEALILETAGALL